MPVFVGLVRTAWGAGWFCPHGRGKKRAPSSWVRSAVLCHTRLGIILGLSQLHPNLCQKGHPSQWLCCGAVSCGTQTCSLPWLSVTTAWHFPSHTIHQDIFRASDPSQLSQGTPFSSNVLCKSALAQLAPANGHARSTLPSESLWMDASEQVLSLLLCSWHSISVSTWGTQLSQKCSVERAGLKTSDQTIVCCAWEHVHLAGVSLAAELREDGFRHDALHLCTSSCSFLPAGLSAHTLVPSLHSCPPSPPCRHSHSSSVPTPFLLCSLPLASSAPVPGASEWVKTRTGHWGVWIEEGVALARCWWQKLLPHLCHALSPVTESRKHLVSLRKVHFSPPNLIWIFPGLPHSFIFASRMCSLTFHSRLYHVLLLLQTARVAKQKHSVLVICSPEL